MLAFLRKSAFYSSPHICWETASVELAGLCFLLSGISLHVILKAMNSKGEKSLKLYREASSNPDLELLLRPPEHGEEEEEDLETPQQH